MICESSPEPPKRSTNTNQAPCLSLVQFQIEDGELVVSAYQRSSDANLGLPADIYHLYLMARHIDFPLKSITLFELGAQFFAGDAVALENLEQICRGKREPLVDKICPHGLIHTALRGRAQKMPPAC